MQENFEKAPLIDRALKWMCDPKNIVVKPRWQIKNSIDYKIAGERNEHHHYFLYGDFPHALTPSWERPHLVWSRHNITENDWKEAFLRALGHEYLQILTTVIKIKPHKGYAAHVCFDIYGQDYVPYVTSLKRGGKGILLMKRSEYEEDIKLWQRRCAEDERAAALLASAKAKLTEDEQRLLGLIK